MTSCPRDCIVLLLDVVEARKLGVNFDFYFYLTSHIPTIFKCCPFYLLSASQFHFLESFCHHFWPGHHHLWCGQQLWPSVPASTFDLVTPKSAQICQAHAHISKHLLDNTSWWYTSNLAFPSLLLGYLCPWLGSPPVSPIPVKHKRHPQ